jgi:hypothetical protein
MINLSEIRSTTGKHSNVNKRSFEIAKTKTQMPSSAGHCADIQNKLPARPDTVL